MRIRKFEFCIILVIDIVRTRYLYYFIESIDSWTKPIQDLEKQKIFKTSENMMTITRIGGISDQRFRAIGQQIMSDGIHKRKIRVDYCHSVNAYVRIYVQQSDSKH